jgi:excinuclease ABC subunit A
MADHVSTREPIRIRGARTHNLQNLDCDIPARALTTVTGVSGSGKSSLVFDTLYAEGQRRFVQSMSTYTRLFLERMERPDVDFINNIPPAIALAQRNTIRNARSTVGTITEINDHLRLLFAHVGEMHCPACGGPVRRDDPDTALGEIERLPEGSTVLVIAPLDVEDLPLPELATGLLRQGFRRVWSDGEVVRLDELDEAGIAALPIAAESAPRNPRGRRMKRRELLVVIDRLLVGRARGSRAREALESAFGLARGRVLLVVDDGAAPSIRLDRRFSCRKCGTEHLEPTPNLFSFNSPLGACPTCEGFGRVTGVDLDKVIPNAERSLSDGAVVPWTTPTGLEMQEWLLKTARRAGVRVDVAWSLLDERERSFVLDGEPQEVKRARGSRRFPGINGFFRWLERKRYKTHVRILLARYRGYTPCDDCSGRRLRPEALAVKVGGLDLAAVAELAIPQALAWVEALDREARISARAATLLAEIRGRLRYLVDVGLDYLTLARQARTLSGGEAQRIHLASALGSALTDTLYCLDEPTVGLHARDSARLLGVLAQLTRAGNTVVLVEHDPQVIEGSDHVIDLGPGGGSRGGRVVWAGPAGEIPSAGTETARQLRSRSSNSEARDRTLRRGDVERARGITITGARENNLKNLTVTIPWDRLTCITGVSGSGKSTLVEQVLYNNHLRMQGQSAEAGACDAIAGLERFEEVVMMTQAPVGRSSRSNPATYLKAYDEIRKLFAATPAARLAKIGPGHFSFNASGGRCEQCGGMGTVTLEMHFMADLTVSCDACSGTRFKPQVLEVRYRGRNINDVLAMTVDDARTFFADQPRVGKRLASLVDVGLGYLRLGQPTSTLSGGEAQRLKLASFVDPAETGRRLLIFDEPTTGLHLSDVARLVEVLHEIVARGNTVVVVEHNLDFIACADWIIDLGPEGGARGGDVVATGTPLEISKRTGTATGGALAALLRPRPKARAAQVRGRETASA